ncbi:MAG: HD-GYP domain-containing protein [Candidatus Eremiobacteraeota bacterium]|nr:HD-GYP domain-containing protein [Candidatus Eremiobacteraeota bacterium]
MVFIPQEGKFFEVKKHGGPAQASKARDDARGKEVQGGSSLLEDLFTETPPPPTMEESPFSPDQGGILSSAKLFGKLSEFVESGLLDTTSLRESLKQAVQNATTSIWSILKKTLDEEKEADDDEIIYMLEMLMKMASSFTYEHSQRVMGWSMSLAGNLNLDAGQLNDIRQGALFRDIGKTGIFFSEASEDERENAAEFLKKEMIACRGCGEFHDIGKLKIPEEIVNKTERLTDEEYEIMKQHPIIGEALLRPIKSLAAILPAVRHHHERWDGKGYPDGISGENIPLSARIVALTDTFDAMISDRPYRKALTREEATGELRKNAGTQFDPHLVEVFLAILAKESSPAGHELLSS